MKFGKYTTSLLLIVIIFCHTLLWQSSYGSTSEPRILLIHWNPVANLIATPHHQLDQDSLQLLGTSVYKINLYKHLEAYGAQVWPLIIDDHQWYQLLIDQGKQAYSLTLTKGKNNAYQIVNRLEQICATEKITIIHCHTDFETQLALRVAKQYNIKVVRTIHIDNNLGDKTLSGANGLICVGPATEKKLTVHQQQNITCIPPFFDENKFIAFMPHRTKDSFFKEEFGITIKNLPIICSVANFYQQYKNHAVLLRAVQKLIHEKNIPVQLVLAGLGPRMEEMQRLAKNLNIENFVYFIGHTKKIPELNFFSDINALTSDVETFGITLLEGALMGKPLVGTRGTGMEGIIRHGQNGLLFNLDDDQDLANMLATIVTDKAYAGQLAQQAHADTLAHFTATSTVKKLIDFYATILSASPKNQLQPSHQQFPSANRYIAQEKNPYPDEISFCIADLKYDGTKIQICELGEGIESRFKGYESLFGHDSVWRGLWDFLGSFNMPTWFVDHWRSSQKEYLLQEFIVRGGRLATTLNALVHDYTFIHASEKKVTRGIRNQAGIIITRSLGKTAHQASRLFKNAHDQFLLLGDATNDFVRSKKSTNELFDTQDLMQYKPAFAFYEKRYYQDLANTICSDLQTDMVVIKPLEASLGDGVIIVERERLDQALKIALKEIDVPNYLLTDSSYTHWRNDTSKKFLAEAYAPSKTIVVNNQPFDPTMRVFFGLYNDNGIIHINFLGAYWKLPISPLTNNCPLTEKLKSHISAQSHNSVKVDEHDFHHVQKLLSECLPKLYEKMLAQRYKKDEKLFTRTPRAKMTLY